METKEVLKQCVVDGNTVRLPDIQLDRKLYLKVKESMELIGGKWKSGKVQGFVFDSDPSDLLGIVKEKGGKDIKKEFQFFETPDELADRLVEMAAPCLPEKILEPSAGRGAIVRAIHRRTPYSMVDGYELMDINRTFLEKLDNFRLMGHDFLNNEGGRYDVIIANPPFAKNQDIDHVREMYERLFTGGRLVSIMSNHWRICDNKKEKSFREWLDSVGGEIHDLERRTFETSGTTVAACIVKIEKK